MKRKNNLCNILDKIDLWKHCFGDIWDYDSLEKVVSTFDIVGIKRKLSVEECLKLKWIKKDNCYLNEAIDCFTTHPCVYIDLSKPSGHSIIAITAPLQYSKNKMEKVRNIFNRHYKYCRNFHRKSSSHKHHNKSYYSEMGSWGSGIPFINGRQVYKNDGTYKMIGIDTMQCRSPNLQESKSSNVFTFFHVTYEGHNNI